MNLPDLPPVEWLWGYASESVALIPFRAAEVLSRRKHHEHTAAGLSRAIEGGIRFLRRSQTPDGSWADFLLPPGASTTWVTAHVCVVMNAVSGFDDCRGEAARYLLRMSEADLSWGYNSNVGNDCDTTSQALIAITQAGMAPPSRRLEWLVQSQNEDGGFPTFPWAGPNPGDRTGWNASHTDVTLMALKALDLMGMEDAVSSARRWLRGRADLFDAYWWNDKSYNIWLMSRLGSIVSSTRRGPLPEADRVRDMPHLAMRVSAVAEVNRVKHCWPRILEAQLSDGSWRCDRCLRLTRPREMVDGGSTLSGRTYRSERRVFSTAHAVACLFGVLEKLSEA